jgi:hypothetical protein
VLRSLDFLGRWKWPNILAVSVLPVAAYFLHWAPQSEPRPFGTVILGPERIGLWSVVVGTNDRLGAGAGQEVTLNVRFCAGCYEQIRRAALAFGDAHRPSEPGRSIVGTPNTLEVSIPVPETTPASGLYLWLTVEGWDEKRYRIFWKVSPGETRMENHEPGRVGVVSLTVLFWGIPTNLSGDQKIDYEKNGEDVADFS